MKVYNNAVFCHTGIYLYHIDAFRYRPFESLSGTLFSNPAAVFPRWAQSIILYRLFCAKVFKSLLRLRADIFIIDTTPKNGKSANILMNFIGLSLYLFSGYKDKPELLSLLQQETPTFKRCFTQLFFDKTLGLCSYSDSIYSCAQTGYIYGISKAFDNGCTTSQIDDGIIAFDSFDM